MWMTELVRIQAWANITDAVLHGDGGGCGVEDGDTFDVVTHCWTGSLFADGFANYLAGF